MPQQDGSRRHHRRENAPRLTQHGRTTPPRATQRRCERTIARLPHCPCKAPARRRAARGALRPRSDSTHLHRNSATTVVDDASNRRHRHLHNQTTLRNAVLTPRMKGVKRREKCRLQPVEDREVEQVPPVGSKSRFQYERSVANVRVRTKPQVLAALASLRVLCTRTSIVKRERRVRVTPQPLVPPTSTIEAVFAALCTGSGSRLPKGSTFHAALQHARPQPPLLATE
jgi:hypothetical protein